MVKEKVKNNKKYYICARCGLAYKEKEWVEKCQSWCKEHRSCNTEIIKHAIKKGGKR